MKKPIPNKAVFIFGNDALPSCVDGKYQAVDKFVHDGCSGLLRIERVDGVEGLGDLDVFMRVFLTNLLEIQDKDKTRADIAMNDILVLSDQNYPWMREIPVEIRQSSSTQVVTDLEEFIASENKPFLIIMFAHLDLKIDQILERVSMENFINCFIARAPADLRIPKKLVPQSYEFKMDQKVQVYDEPLIFTYNSLYATRRDRVPKFDPQLIANVGANGQILVFHCLSEVAFIIGKTPKYGA